MVLQHSTKFTTTITFLQKDCFFYNVEILNIIYIVVYQCNMSDVEVVESVEVVSYLYYIAEKCVTTVISCCF